MFVSTSSKLLIAALCTFTVLLNKQSVIAQSIIINEVSQGTSGSQEYVEFLVTGPDLVNCNDTPPCLDLRLWIFDDNNGYLNGGPTSGVGIAGGACRFADNPFWGCIPAGTIIVIYNDADPNAGIPPQDLDMADGNCTLCIPVSSNLFDRHTSQPSSSNSSYTTTGWISGGGWTQISMANGGDGFQIYDPANLTVPVFSIGWGSSNNLGDIWMGSSTASGDVFYATDCNYYSQGSWVQGAASTDQTAGASNNAAQDDCIGNMNANCNAPSLVINTTAATGCSGSCNGTATAIISGGTPPFSLSWSPAPTGGQGTTSATGLCAGNYTLTLIDDNGTGGTLTTAATVNSGGGGDVIPPTASNPTNITVQCQSDIPTPDPLVVTDEADNATANPIVAYVADVSDGNSCPETITRTYSVTDDCGNSINVTQQIIVDDTTPPTASNPAQINVACSSDIPAPDPLVVTDEMDNCNSPLVAFVSEISDGNSCPETITRTYSITDDCGNSINVVQLIVVNDIIAPIASAPATITVSCASDVPAPDPAVVTDEVDNCTANPIVQWVSDISDGNVCDHESITRNYSITDDCGNSINVSQIIVIDAITPAIDAGTDQTICEGNLVTLSAINPDGAAILWDQGIVDGISFTPPSGNSSYTVTADICLGACVATDQVTISTSPIPTADFVADTNMVCENSTIAFTNLSTNQTTCSWDFGNATIINDCGDQSVSYLHPGIYDVSLTVTNAGGCAATQTYSSYIEVVERPHAAFQPSQTTLYPENTEVLFYNHSQNAVAYWWDFGDNTSGTNTAEPNHIFPNTTGNNYTVTLTAYNALGCEDQTTAVVQVQEDLILYVPNAFTPNGDGMNQLFQPIFTSGYAGNDYHFTIFNRWGEVLFESYDATVGWDGTYGNQLVDDGIYIWKIDFRESLTDKKYDLKGHVSVLK